MEEYVNFQDLAVLEWNLNLKNHVTDIAAVHKTSQISSVVSAITYVCGSFNY